MHSLSRRLPTSAVQLHAAAAALPFPSGASTVPTEKQRGPNGTAARLGEIVIVAHGAASNVTIPGPVYLCGAEEIPGLAANIWNRIGAALNGGQPIVVTDKEAYAERVLDAAAYKQLALFNGGGVFTGGGVVDVYFVPYETTPV